MFLAFSAHERHNMSSVCPFHVVKFTRRQDDVPVLIGRLEHLASSEGLPTMGYPMGSKKGAFGQSAPIGLKTSRYREDLQKIGS